jgi:hypothetical protein
VEEGAEICGLRAESEGESEGEEICDLRRKKFATETVPTRCVKVVVWQMSVSDKKFAGFSPQPRSVDT